MPVLTYDPGEVSVTIGPDTIFGLSSGVMVRVEHNQPTFTPYYGTQGEASRAAVRDQSGMVTIRTAATSPQNDILDLITRVDHIVAPNVTLPILIRDASGRFLAAGVDSYLKQRPTREMSNEVTELEWQFEVPVLEVFQGGN